MKNISIKNFLAIIILIKGAFQLDRRKKKKIGASYSQKQTTEAKWKNRQKRTQTIFPFRVKHGRAPWEYTLIII